MIERDPAYISHGEIQTGLALDASHWASDLSGLYADDFATLGDDRDLLVARTPDGSVIGFAIVAWEASSRVRFGVLEDMAVDPAFRAGGIGGALVDNVEARVRERGLDWLFLESGLGNEGAHRFFERHGFHAMSKVFAKQVGG